MQSLYADYVRLYLLKGYSRKDSEFYARLETKDVREGPEPRKPSNNADKEIPEALSRGHDQETEARINRRIEVLLNKGYKCFSQACCQAEAMIVTKKWLSNIELDKIKEECEDDCCKPAGSSTSATSSSNITWINAPIPEAATEHPEIRRLLNLADENSKSSEAAAEHSENPEAACQASKRPRKSGKGNISNP